MGIGTTIMLFHTNAYYIIVLAWTLHFFFSSFAAELPWATCGNWWNTEHCRSAADALLHGDVDAAVNETTDSVVEYWE